MGIFDQTYKPAFGAAFSPNQASMQDPFASLTGWGASPSMASGLVPQISPFGAAPVGVGSVSPAMSLAPAGGINLGVDASGATGLGGWLRSSGFLSSKDVNGMETQGWGGPALGLAGAGLNAFMGMKQFNLAKETLQANKDQYAQNFDAQRTTTNSALEDRQRARVASNSSAYQSVGDYMDKNRIR